MRPYETREVPRVGALTDFDPPCLAFLSARNEVLSLSSDSAKLESVNIERALTS
jgi:hypothetical protein